MAMTPEQRQQQLAALGAADLGDLGPEARRLAFARQALQGGQAGGPAPPPPPGVQAQFAAGPQTPGDVTIQTSDTPQAPDGMQQEPALPPGAIDYRQYGGGLMLPMPGSGGGGRRTVTSIQKASMSPEERAAYEASIAEQKGAIASASDKQNDALAEQKRMTLGFAARSRANAQNTDKRYQKRKGTYEDSAKATEDAQKKVDESGVDSQRYLRNMTGFQKAMFYIAAALGGANQAAGGGPNRTFDILNDAIDRDINDQKVQLKKAMDRLGMAKEAQEKAFARMESTRQEKKEYGMEYAKLMLAANATGKESAAVDFRTAQAISDIEQKKLAMLQATKEKKTVQITKGGGGGRKYVQVGGPAKGGKPVKLDKDAQALRDGLVGMSAQLLPTAQQIRKAGTGGPFKGVWNELMAKKEGTEEAKAKGAVGMIVMERAKAVSGTNFTEQQANMIEKDTPSQYDTNQDLYDKAKRTGITLIKKAVERGKQYERAGQPGEAQEMYLAAKTQADALVQYHGFLANSKQEDIRAGGDVKADPTLSALRHRLGGGGGASASPQDLGAQRR